MTLAGKQAVVPDSTSGTGLATAKLVTGSMCSFTTLRVGSPEVFATTIPSIRLSSVQNQPASRGRSSTFAPLFCSRKYFRLRFVTPSDLLKDVTDAALLAKTSTTPSIQRRQP